MAPLVEALPGLAESIPTQGTRTLRGDSDDLGDAVPSEAHHAHLAAVCLADAGYAPVLEVYYDQPIVVNRTKSFARADVWAPSPAPADDDAQVFLELKLALLYDGRSRRVGGPGYGLGRAVESWAGDFYRLLVGPKGRTRCGFLLACYLTEGNVGLDGIAGNGDDAGAVGPRAIDAGQFQAQVEALADTATSLDAIRQLAGLVRNTLHGRVSLLGGPVKLLDAPLLYAAPLLFEWVQQGPARSG